MKETMTDETREKIADCLYNHGVREYSKNGAMWYESTHDNSREFTRSLARHIISLPEFQAGERLREALIKLSNEVLGSLPLMEPLARQELGNTNYSILIQRAEEARAILAAIDNALEER